MKMTYEKIISLISGIEHMYYDGEDDFGCLSNTDDYNFKINYTHKGGLVITNMRTEKSVTINPFDWGNIKESVKPYKDKMYEELELAVVVKLDEEMDKVMSFSEEEISKMTEEEQTRFLTKLAKLINEEKERL